MPIHTTINRGQQLVHVKVSDRLTTEEFQKFVPVYQQCVSSLRQPSVLFEMEDFSGWDPGALWQDFKVEGGPHAGPARVAIVGDNHWEKWMTAICKPFAAAETRYFDRSDIDRARRWAASKGVARSMAVPETASNLTSEP